MQLITFYALAAFAVLAGLAILAGRDLMRMACWLIGMLLAAAGLMFVAGGWVPALAQLILLAGGTGTLFFVSAFHLARKGEGMGSRLGLTWLGLIPAICLALAGMIYLLLNMTCEWAIRSSLTNCSLTQAGMSFLKPLLGPFLLMPIFLLVGGLCAAHLIRRPTAAGPEKSAEPEHQATEDEREGADA